MAPDGGIVTDVSLRTSHPSGDVFAAGDVACAPVPLAGDRDGNVPTTAARFEHVTSARNMGAHAARAMLGGIGDQESYESVPHMYSRLVLWTAVNVDSSEDVACPLFRRLQQGTRRRTVTKCARCRYYGHTVRGVSPYHRIFISLLSFCLDERLGDASSPQVVQRRQ